MKKLLLISLLMVPQSAYSYDSLTHIDTTHYDSINVGAYDVGDSVGGIRVAAVKSLAHADFPLYIGKNSTHGGDNQGEWDVFVLDSNMTLNLNALGLSDSAIIHFKRHTTGSVAPELVIIDFQDYILTVDMDSNLASGKGNHAVIDITEIGGNSGTTGGVGDSIIIKNGEIRHNLNMVQGGGGASPTFPSHGRLGTIKLAKLKQSQLINLDIKVNYATSVDKNRYDVGGIGIMAFGASPGSDWGMFDMYLDDVHVWNYSRAFYRRDQVWASGMALGNTHYKDSMQSLFGFTPDYHYTVKNCVVHITPHFGFYMHGSLDFHHNICSTAARNDYYEYFAGSEASNHQTATKRATTGYTFPDGSYPGNGKWPVLDSGIAYGDVCNNGWNCMWSSSNSYAFVFSEGNEAPWGIGPSRIHNNSARRAEMYGSEKWQGNRGYSFETPWGQSDDSILIYDNDATVSQGREGFFSVGQGWGMRVRWGGQYVRWSGNNFTYIIDSREADGTALGSVPSSAGPRGHAVRFSMNVEGGGDSLTNFIFENNRGVHQYHIDSTLDAGSTGSNVADVSGFGVSMDNGRLVTPIWSDPNSIWRYNYWESPTVGIYYGGAGTEGVNLDGPMHNFTIFGDTISTTTDYDTAGWATISADYGTSEPDSNNLFLDLVMLDSATQYDFTGNASSGDDYWRWGRQMNILAVGTGTPPNVGVAVCSIFAQNGYSQTVQNYVAVNPSTAVLSDTFFFHRIGDGAFEPDSLNTSFNDFTFRARDDNDSTADSTVTVDWLRSNGLVLVFSGVAGSIDTTGWNGSPAAAASGPRAKFRK